MTTLVWKRDAAFVAVCRNLVAVRWTGVPGREQLVALAHAHRAARERGEDVLLLNDVYCLTGTTRVEGRAYDQMVELVERCRDQTRAVAHVVEIPGAAGAVTRAFLGTLERIAGNGHARTATFETADAGAAWLARVGGADIVSRWRAMQGAAETSMAA